MRYIKIITIILFFVLLLIPVAAFNWEEDSVSEIDNRMLANNPFNDDRTNKDLSDCIDSFVQDRIGFRDSIISSYTIINDKLFHKMVHPAYDYGKNGYVFTKYARNKQFGDYEVTFADMVAKIQKYCLERNVPFLFVFNPDKVSIYPSEIKDGVNYNNDWVQEFRTELEKGNINYVDNSVIIKEKADNGERVFNKLYNAGHWNDLGAFYGVNNILENLQTYYPNLHINQRQDFNITEKLNTSLMISKFPIDEYEPIFEPKCVTYEVTDKYSEELQIHPQHKEFHYYINPQERSKGAPKALVFQGSYMNGMGYKFMMNSLGEYIIVHDYQNIIDFEYYYNIFKPDCVIFEVAEYTFKDYYFSLQNMKDMRLNPCLDREVLENIQTEKLSNNMLSITYGKHLASVRVNKLPYNTEYAYIIFGDEVYDLRKNGDTYTVTVERENIMEQATVIIETGKHNYIKYE